MNRKIFLFLFALVLTLSLGSFERISGQYEMKIVESVDIQGNRIYTDKELFKFIITKRGQKLTREVADDLKTLQSLDFLDKKNVRLIIQLTSKNKVAVIFQIRELPIIEKVEIEGLKYLTKEEIFSELRMENIEIKKPYNPKKMIDVKKRVSACLAERGLFDAKITVFEEQLSAMTIRIGLIIDEMPNDDGDDEENNNLN